MKKLVLLFCLICLCGCSSNDIPKEKNNGCAPFTGGILSSAKLRKLGWNPNNTLEEGFLRTIHYLEIEKEKGCL